MSGKVNGFAHFEICTCGKHGRIVFPDGRTGGEIASKEEFDYVLQYVMLVDKFQGVDIFPNGKLQHISDEVRTSTLPATNAEVSDYFKKLLNTWNQGKLHQPNLNPVDFHKVADKLWDYDAFDS